MVLRMRTGDGMLKVASCIVRVILDIVNESEFMCLCVWFLML